MKCKCGSPRFLKVDAKCSDQCYAEALPSGDVSDGYVPSGIGLGGGDYMSFKVCLVCGLIQDWETVPHVKLRAALEAAG